MAHSNYAVFVVVVAHFHGAVSPRLVPIKRPEGGSPKIPSNYAVVFEGGRGETGGQAGGSQAASLGPSASPPLPIWIDPTYNLEPPTTA